MLPLLLDLLFASLALGICSVARLPFVFAGLPFTFQPPRDEQSGPYSRLVASLPPHKIGAFLICSASLEIVLPRNVTCGAGSRQRYEIVSS